MPAVRLPQSIAGTAWAALMLCPVAAPHRRFDGGTQAFLPCREQALHHCSAASRSATFFKPLWMLQALYGATKQRGDLLALRELSAVAGEHGGQRVPAAGGEPSAWHGPAAGSPTTPQQARAARPPHQPLPSLRCPDLPPPRPASPRPALYRGSVLPPHLAAAIAIMQELRGFLSPCSEGFSLNKKKSLFHCLAPHANPFQMN